MANVYITENTRLLRDMSKNVILPPPPFNLWNAYKWRSIWRDAWREMILSVD